MRKKEDGYGSMIPTIQGTGRFITEWICVGFADVFYSRSVRAVQSLDCEKVVVRYSHTPVKQLSLFWFFSVHNSDQNMQLKSEIPW